MLSLLQKLGEGYRHLCMYRCTVGTQYSSLWNKPGPHPCASAMGSCGMCVAPLSEYWMSRVEGNQTDQVTLLRIGLQALQGL